MLENLIDEALSYEVDGLLELCIYKDKDFVRFDFRDTRREKSQEELNLLFYPHLSRMKQGQEGVLTGTEYLICKQVIRDHDELPEDAVAVSMRSLPLREGSPYGSPCLPVECRM